MTSSTDVSSTRAVLRGPTHTIAYPPKVFEGRRGYNPSPSSSKSGSPSSSRYSKPSTRSTSPISSYQKAFSDKSIPSYWRFDRTEPNIEQAHLDQNWKKAIGWSMAGTESGDGASLSKLSSVLCILSYSNKS